MYLLLTVDVLNLTGPVSKSSKNKQSPVVALHLCSSFCFIKKTNTRKAGSQRTTNKKKKSRLLLTGFCIRLCHKFHGCSQSGTFIMGVCLCV